MNIKKSKKLSYLLRHNPEDLLMDKNGWVLVTEILNKLDISIDELIEIVKTNDKQRFSFNQDYSKIRANQGHTIPIDLELVEKQPPIYLYHGTSPTFIDKIICSGGLMKMKRQHVHLSLDKDTAYKVGRRHSKDLEPSIIVIDSGKMYKDGFKFYLSDNGVWLTDFVPKKYFKI